MNIETTWALLATELPRDVHAELLADVDVDELIASVELARAPYSTTRRRPVTASAYELLLDRLPVATGVKLARRVTTGDATADALVLLRQPRVGLQREAALTGEVVREAFDRDLAGDGPTGGHIDAVLAGLDHEDRYDALRRVGSVSALGRYLTARRQGRRDLVDVLDRWMPGMLAGGCSVDGRSLTTTTTAVEALLDDLDAGRETALTRDRDRVVQLWLSQLRDGDDEHGAGHDRHDRLAGRLYAHGWAVELLLKAKTGGTSARHLAQVVDTVADGRSDLPAGVQAAVAVAVFPVRADRWVDAGRPASDRSALLGLLAAVPPSHLDAEPGWPAAFQSWHLNAGREDALRRIVHVDALLVEAGLRDRHTGLDAAVELIRAGVDSGGLTVDAARGQQAACQLLRLLAGEAGHGGDVDDELSGLEEALAGIVADDPLAGAFDAAVADARRGCPDGLEALDERARTYVDQRLAELDDDTLASLRLALARTAPDGDALVRALATGTPRIRTERREAVQENAVGAARIALSEAEAGDPALLVRLATLAPLPARFTADELVAIVSHAPAAGLALVARHPNEVQEQVVAVVADDVERLAADDADVAEAALKCRADRWKDLTLLLAEVEGGRRGNVTDGMRLIGPLVHEIGGLAAVQTLTILVEGWAGTWASLRDAALSLAGADEATVRAAAAESRLAALTA